MKEKSVIISLWSAGSCGRQQLAGILRYINAGRPWNVRIIMDPREFTPATIAEAKTDGIDGFIAFAGRDTARALARTNIPTVLLSYPTPEITRRKRNLVLFVNDNEDIGRKGADYLLSLGTFATFAFVPDLSGRGWSVLREKSFRQSLEKAGHDCVVYRPADGDLDAWLRSLPKPAAVMTPFDFRARDVIAACRTTHLVVPEQVTVLSVDNDELICETSKPTISSIAIDQERIGELAAKTLDVLMAAPRPRPTETRIVSSGPVVERESTRHVAPGVHLARRIKGFIEDHFKDGVNADDVAARLGVSRRLADLRFSKAFNMTVREALEERRLAEIKRYLDETTLPIAKISRLCGYRNELWIKYVFKRRFGMTMSAWRLRKR